MNIHALYSLILTSSAHLFCKGLPNIMSTTFVLLIGLSKASYISSRDVIHNRKCVCERCAHSANGAIGHWHMNTRRSNNSHSPGLQDMGHLPSLTESQTNLEDHTLFTKAAHHNCM